MKTLYITANGHIAVDSETNEICDSGVESDRISRMFVVTEPTKICFSRGTEQCEVEAEEGDIVVVFFANTYKNPIALVKSPMWIENIKLYHEEEQKRKEDWAEKQNNTFKESYDTDR